MNTNRAALPAALLVVIQALGSAQTGGIEWPQFRGPSGQGHATQTGLPVEWSETQNVLWKVPVPGTGWSSPVIGGGRIWLTTAVDNAVGRGRRGQVSLRALAFDVETGKSVVDVEVFRIDGSRALNPKNSWASPTPILDGDRVYVHFGADGTAALSTSGDVLWTTRLRYESQHGNGGSPTLYRDLLLINCDGNSDEAYVVALDVATGKPRWKKTRRAPADQAYSTPLVIRVGERDQFVSVGAYRTVAYDPSNGDEIWRVSYDDGFSNVPRPVYGQGLVYIATGFQVPSLIAVRPDGRGDVTRTHKAWTLTRGAPFTPSPLLVGNDLYVVSDTGVLTLVDATSGDVVQQQRLGGNYSASPTFADGRIYFQNEEGVTTVLAPGRDLRRLATNRLDGSMLASMAVAGRSFILRTDRSLYRIGT